MKKLLLEIGTEEIPAAYIPAAANRLREIAKEKLKTALLPFGEIDAFGTPRRIVLTVDGLPEKQKKESRKVSGPPKSAALGKDGKPTKAGEGFAAKFGMKFEDLRFESTPKGEYACLTIDEGGGNTPDILKETLPGIISEIPFPKTMRWGDGAFRFARPIRSILALLDGDVIDFEIEGLRSGNSTFGHRFLANDPVSVSNPADYEPKLKAAGVYVTPAARKEIMEKSFADIEEKLGVKVIRDEELMDTVCYLTENPVAVVGSFDRNYLELPRELLITVMKHHQRYFSVENKDGKITNNFVAFSNIACEEMDTVRKGYERVLKARLSDARFFFDEDRKHPLSHFTGKLAGMVYIKGLGTVEDRVERIVKIATSIAEVLAPEERENVRSAASLCKADLGTAMVYEFPELQGIMGREYAKAEGLDEKVANAIDQHYRPRFSGDDLPEGSIATCVALAEKTEALVGCFSLGLSPTGSEDPFSLRRHALGIIRILLSGMDSLSISTLLDFGKASFPPSESMVWGENGLNWSQKEEIMGFLAGRIKGEFQGRGLEYDVVEAVLAAGFNILPDTLKKCAAMAEMKKQDYSENLSITFKRAANIVKEHHSTEIDENLLSEEVEKRLFARVNEVSGRVAPLKREKNYTEALREIAGIRGDVDAFFDGVMVMADDENVKRNRLSLLRKVTVLFDDIADFSKLVF